jgi:hypothetical protein
MRITLSNDEVRQAVAGYISKKFSTHVEVDEILRMSLRRKASNVEEVGSIAVVLKDIERVAYDERD